MRETDHGTRRCAATIGAAPCPNEAVRGATLCREHLGYRHASDWATLYDAIIRELRSQTTLSDHELRLVADRCARISADNYGDEFRLNHDVLSGLGIPGHDAATGRRLALHERVKLLADGIANESSRVSSGQRPVTATSSPNALHADTQPVGPGSDTTRPLAEASRTGTERLFKLTPRRDRFVRVVVMMVKLGIGLLVCCFSIAGGVAVYGRYDARGADRLLSPFGRAWQQRIHGGGLVHFYGSRWETTPLEWLYFPPQSSKMNELFQSCAQPSADLTPSVCDTAGQALRTVTEGFHGRVTQLDDARLKAWFETVACPLLAQLDRTRYDASPDQGWNRYVAHGCAPAWT